MVEVVWPVSKVSDAGRPSPFLLFTHRRSKILQRVQTFGSATAPADADVAVVPKDNFGNPKLSNDLPGTRRAPFGP